MTKNIKIVYPGDITFMFPLETTLTNEDLLEEIFHGFNHGSSREHKIFLDSNRRSLSVNDFVCIDNQWYQCITVGWLQCSAMYYQDIELDVKEKKVSNAEYQTCRDGGAWISLHEVMLEKN